MAKSLKRDSSTSYSSRKVCGVARQKRGRVSYWVHVRDCGSYHLHQPSGDIISRYSTTSVSDFKRSRRTLCSYSPSLQHAPHCSMHCHFGCCCGGLESGVVVGRHILVEVVFRFCVWVHLLVVVFVRMTRNGCSTKQGVDPISGLKGNEGVETCCC